MKQAENLNMDLNKKVLPRIKKEYFFHGGKVRYNRL